MAIVFRGTEAFAVNPEILNLDDRVVFFPVRHHSPTAARLAAQLIKAMRPAAVLIEGPADFNDRIHELFLPHTLPIAIYTYFRSATKQRGAFYPFCIYSPEWQAAQTAHQLGAHVNFIDMPWQEMGNAESRQHLYSDADLRENDYISLVCQRLGLEGFDELWDDMIEAPADLTLPEYMTRCHHLCYQMRNTRRQVDYEDIVREEFMAGKILATMERLKGRVLVVTGGFHSHALFERVHGIYSPSENNLKQPSEPDTNYCNHNLNLEDDIDAEDSAGENGDEDEAADETADDEIVESGIALTPYSYSRLDSLIGYNAGMPSPGFYHQVFLDRNEIGSSDTHKKLLFHAAENLRKQKKQAISSADLIAVETSAIALARLRGHQHVWRTDLTDAIISALVKDEIVAGYEHPMLTALHDALRGDARGKLAKGTLLPPLVDDVETQLRDYGLQPTPGKRATTIQLTESEGLKKSRLLHQLACIDIAGYSLTAASSLSGDERGSVFEEWAIAWSPNFDASLIEASVYGATLKEAASNRLTEVTAGVTDSELAAKYLARACSMGLSELGEKLSQQMDGIIRGDQRFHAVTSCAAQLLYLYKYDQLLSEKPLADLGKLMQTAFDRSVWLLESLGRAAGNDLKSVTAIGNLVELLERCGADLHLDRKYLVEVFNRARNDNNQAALVRGALTGALWVLQEAQIEAIDEDLTLFQNPQTLGDFLTGLFHLAGEVVQRNPDLVKSLDDILMGYDDEQFLEAAPSMRQAFAYFSPREKHFIASSILKAAGHTTHIEPLTTLSVDVGTAERALAIEIRVKTALKQFGIRGLTNE